MLLQAKRCLFFITSWYLVSSCTMSAVHAATPEEKALVARIEQLTGHLTRSPTGEIVAIDLENRPATDDDMKLLVAAPNLKSSSSGERALPIRGSNHSRHSANLKTCN